MTCNTPAAMFFNGLPMLLRQENGLCHPERSEGSHPFSHSPLVAIPRFARDTNGSGTDWLYGTMGLKLAAKMQVKAVEVLLVARLRDMANRLRNLRILEGLNPEHLGSALHGL